MIERNSFVFLLVFTAALLVISCGKNSDKSKVVGLQMVSVLKKKTNAKITGGFTFVYHDLHKATGPQIEVEMGLPISRKAKRQKGFKSRKTADFKCSYQSFEGQTKQLKAAWTALYQQTLDAGHQLAGESRTVVLNPSTQGRVSLELQLGIL